MDLLLSAYSDANYGEMALRVSEAREQECGAARLLSVALNRRLAR